jgi:hypothetical protein
LRCRSELKSQQPGDPDRKSYVVVLPVDPFQVHVYWIIEPAELQEAELTLGEGSLRPSPVLRFYRIPHSSFDLKGSDAFLEIRIDLDAPNWYVHLPKPARRYFVDLGLRTEDGRFSALARSTIIETPPASPSENHDETLMFVLGDCVLRDPPSGRREDQPLNAPPAPLLRDNSGHGDGLGFNSDPLRESFSLPPTSSRPDTPSGAETTGPAQTASAPDTGSGTSVEHHLVEKNERSFASGLSSVLLGDGSPGTLYTPTQ